MFIWKFVTSILKLIVFLVIGFIFTDTILRVIYENFGIQFIGNIWVNWLGVSFLFYFLYTVIMKTRIISILFWVLLFAAVYIIFIPFIIGRNPF